MNDLTAISSRIPAAPGSEFSRGLRTSIPVMLGFVPFALVLGSQAAQKELNALEVPLLTGLNFAGGSEFAAVELWTSPPAILLIVAVTLLVNSRHILMGAALAPMLRHLPKRQAMAALFLMCDESWAIGMDDARKHGGRLSLPFYFGVAVPLYLTWIVFTAIGALIGPALGDITRYGFDMAFPAVFLVMLAGMWKGPVAARPWIVSLIVAGATYHFIPGAWYVPAGAISGVLAAYLWAKPE